MTSTHPQWDIVSSVGLTALGVAAGRAVETERANALITDPYAAEFVRTANPPTPMPITVAEADGDGSDPMWSTMATYLGVRSRFFDDYFAAAGVDQVVILAAGLDTRAYRLNWAPGCDLYEIDQPKVLEFKQEVLDRLGAQPSCRRHPVPTDLRDDWVAALGEAGFDPARPTAWLAEGLLPYLPARAEEELFDRVHKLSVPGSRIAIEKTGDRGPDDLLDDPEFQGASERFGVDLRDLWQREPRRDCAEWLGSAGWQVTVETAAELFRRYNRELVPGFPEAIAGNHFAVAHRAG
ncbi:class I SAM-dependent methyltransferase [Amycolatopsis anabasis]|uniref:class I SAM-dependent methyltransferase n=1 Tax=Amycolatopsis anabasis TaxID=1840409 RepID=UPI001FEAFD39|nr:class I SAM-dependent methyltransferase [Amycolatopsis anabasis]